MPRLVLLNGAPASGKSTVARALAEGSPLALVLDIDVLRASLGGWFEEHRASGLRARALALAAAETQLRAGGDVYVPQFLGRPDFVVQLADLAERTGATFVELLLDADADELAARFADRSAAGERQEHLDADALHRASGASLEDQVAAARAIASARPATVTIDVRGTDPAAVVAAVREIVDAAPASVAWSRTIPTARGDYELSTDPARLDLDVIHGFLCTAYWSEGIPRELLAEAIAHSLGIGLYAPDGSQVGFLRVVGDGATFAYVADVFVLDAHRGLGLGVALAEAAAAHPWLTRSRRVLLATKDAHDLYRKVGFRELHWPERMLEILRLDIYAGAERVVGDEDVRGG